MSERCFDCKHKIEVAGNCHIKCDKGENDQRMSIVGMYAMMVLIDPKNAAARADLELPGTGWSVKVSPHGVRNGWCMFPMLFDPTWVSGCTGFIPEKEDILV